MPMYTFACTQCGRSTDEPRTMAARDKVEKCKECGGRMERDRVASMHPHTDTGYQKEMESQALGVNPDQIPGIQKRFPHHRFNPKNGAMLIGSHQEFKRVLKDIGYRDWNSFY